MMMIMVIVVNETIDANVHWWCVCVSVVVCVLFVCICVLLLEEIVKRHSLYSAQSLQVNSLLKTMQNKNKNNNKIDRYSTMNNIREEIEIKNNNNTNYDNRDQLKTRKKKNARV